MVTLKRILPANAAYFAGVFGSLLLLLLLFCLMFQQKAEKAREENRTKCRASTKSDPRFLISRSSPISKSSLFSSWEGSARKAPPPTNVQSRAKTLHS